MKKIIVLALSLMGLSAIAQNVTLPDYVRGSIYSIRLNSPITSQADFSKQTAQMKEAFDNLNYEEHFRKYNAFNAGPRVMEDVPAATDEQAAVIAAKMGRKNANAFDKKAAAILAQLEKDKVANRLVCKWFSKEGNDGSKFDYDPNYGTIAKLGLMSLSEDQKANAKLEGTATLDVAKAMADPLLNGTYVIVTDFDFLTGPEMVQKKIDEKTAPLYEKLAKAPAMLQETLKGTIQSTIDMTRSTFEAAFPADMQLIESHSYLYRLVWDSEEDFYANGLDKDFSKADYHLEYIETASGYSALVSTTIVNTDKSGNKVANKAIKALDRNISRLGNKYPDFSPVEVLYTAEDGSFYVKAGTEEGLTSKSTLTPLAKAVDKKTGAVTLKVGGSLAVAKDGLWNNNTDADNIEANQDAAEDKGNADLKYTILTGKAKDCSYVKLISPKAYKDAEKKAAKRAKK